MTHKKSATLITVLTVLIFTLLTSPLNATSIFATGMVNPQSITQTDSGDFLVTDATGAIWTVSASGGTASLLATVPYTALGGIILPATFDSLGGKFLVVGFLALSMGSARGEASTIDTSVTPATVTPYLIGPIARTSWAQPVLASSFGSYSGDILVTNEYSAVDFFAPNGAEGTVARFPNHDVEPFGAVLAPSGFGTIGGTLLVSDANSGAIYSVDSLGNVSLFATIPLAATKHGAGLRDMAFAPQGFGSYGGDLFVGGNSGAIYVVNGEGTVIGHISGTFFPRGLLFTGDETLLFSDVISGRILSAVPGDVEN